MKKGLYETYIKRLMDLVLSFLALIVLSPVIIICMILIKRDLGKPIFFRQRRPGKDEEIFEIYKFKTMLNLSESEGMTENDRLCGVGIKLRSTSLDELPQLINILKGDMSIVGPRPLMESYLPYYTEEERLRHSVRPGLTGLSQISGRNHLKWDERLKKDIEYVSNITFLGDVSIILKTFMKVIKRSDVEIDIDHGEGSLDEVRKNEGKN